MDCCVAESYSRRSLKIYRRSRIVARTESDGDFVSLNPVFTGRSDKRRFYLFVVFALSKGVSMPFPSRRDCITPFIGCYSVGVTTAASVVGSFFFSAQADKPAASAAARKKRTVFFKSFIRISFLYRRFGEPTRL